MRRYVSQIASGHEFSPDKEVSLSRARIAIATRVRPRRLCARWPRALCSGARGVGYGDRGFRRTFVRDVRGGGEQHLELLHYACEYGHMELIAFLIHQGVDIFVPDADGSFPPSLASRLLLPSLALACPRPF